MVANGHGCIIAGIFSLVDRDSGARELLAREPYQFVSGFTLDELLMTHAGEEKTDG